ncbi:MAG TPA: SRPBCC domain-containing protein [Haliangiales bacterium]|nr:SRPBCC domain-containing protein [Haliangiales bacterium]
MTGAPTLTIVRTFAAPVAEVFAAWTDAATLRRWLAPGRCEVIEATADARPGGKYRIVVVDPVGGRHVTSGEYREVVPGKRLVKTWVYEGQNAPDGYPTLLTVDFRALGPRSTEIRLRQDQLITEADREGNREGWRLCFDKLDALL